MKKFMFLAFFLPLSFAVCMALDMPAATQLLAATEKPKPAAPPAKNAAKLIGAWSNHPKTAIKNSSRWVEFRADGTFAWHQALDNNKGEQSTAGHYRVENDTIFCTNVKYTYHTKSGDSHRNFTNEPGRDLVWKYKFTHRGIDNKFTNLDWLEINFYPAETSSLNTFEPFVKPLH